MSKLAISIAVLALAACGNDDVDDPPVDELTTWYQDVGPIVANRCATCHQDGGIAPFSLTTFEQAAEQAQRMLDAVVGNVMPPWDARESDDCAPSRAWKDDPRLTPAEIETLRAWIADGRPAGTVATLPAPLDTALQGVTHTIAPTTPYVTAGRSDEFMCFVMQPALANTVEWMTGMQVRAGNAAVVHHVVLNAMAPGPDLDALVASVGVGTAFDCEDPMTTMNGAYFLGVWVPGMQPMQTSDQLSLPLAQGGAVIMQIHYHPAGVVNEPDVTSIDLRLTSTWPQKMYRFTSFGNASAAPELLADPDDRGEPEFRVPAGKADHREHMRFTVDTKSDGVVPVFAAFPHMHYVGIELEVRVTRPVARPNEPATECLLGVPRWNFDWQRMYIYDTPIAELPTLATGDVIDVECSWNNTLANPFVQRLLDEAGLGQPVDLDLGEQTFNEMCLGAFAEVVDVPADDNRIAPARLVEPLLFENRLKR